MLGEQKIIIIASPNGAGKTTFAKAFLPDEAQCKTFINADLIAAGISPFAPESAAIAAGRIMLSLIRQQVQARQSFAFETTLSGMAYARAISKWRKLGYQVELIFLALPSLDYAIERVTQRVKQGGHHTPADVVVRRFHAGLRNFEQEYKPIVDAWICVDGSTINSTDWGEMNESSLDNLRSMPKPLNQAKTQDFRHIEMALRRAQALAIEVAENTIHH